eukprot:scaffold200614_cov26-Tisochrysis_lutea.AAC.2
MKRALHVTARRQKVGRCSLSPNINAIECETKWVLGGDVVHPPRDMCKQGTAPTSYATAIACLSCAPFISPSILNQKDPSLASAGRQSVRTPDDSPASRQPEDEVEVARDASLLRPDALDDDPPSGIAGASAASARDASSLASGAAAVIEEGPADEGDGATDERWGGGVDTRPFCTRCSSISRSVVDTC